jgi:hypothetical protein
MGCTEYSVETVLGLVDHTHPTTTEFFEDAVVRDGLANHGQRLAYLAERHQSSGFAQLLFHFRERGN